MPYQERLPLGRAHDVHVVRTCAELAGAGHDVRLLVGAGTPPAERLLAHYGLPAGGTLRVHRLPIMRRAAGVSWGGVFHVAARWAIRWLAGGAATVVLASTLKLARALLRDPHWALRAAHELGVRVGEGVNWPPQYHRALLD